MSSDEYALIVDRLSKTYTTYAQPIDRLKQSIVPRINRLLGDPVHNFYREFHALDEVSFKVKRGETWGIIGRNGSGKSTLLQLVCGTLTPTSGSVTINGKVAALLELGAGFHPEFTGRQNVYINASILGLTRNQVDERMESILNFADIGDFVDQPVKTYSSGMYVRLAFAVIAHVDADILIIDEALAVGDIYFVQKCMRFIRKFMENGTVLFVSHDTASIASLCDHAIWLQDGKAKLIGSQKEVAEAYLADYYASIRPKNGKGIIASETKKTAMPDFQATMVDRDMRADFINQTNLRNDLEVLQFDESASSFGVGGADILHCSINDQAGQRLTWVVGGEVVVIHVVAVLHVNVARPIIGFVVKDRLGQSIFGDNTYLRYEASEQSAKADDVLNARFSFRMPILPRGDYAVGIAISQGTQVDHQVLKWIHSCLVFKSHSTSLSTGLVGIPMFDIEMKISSAEVSAS